MSTNDLRDIKEPAVVAGILVARARSHAANGDREKVVQTLEAVDEILSKMRDDETLPFVWRTSMPAQQQTHHPATRSPLVAKCGRSDQEPCALRRNQTNQTTDTCVENCACLCERIGQIFDQCGDASPEFHSWASTDVIVPETVIALKAHTATSRRVTVPVRSR